MPASAKNTALAVSLLAAALLGTLAWRRHLELASLQADVARLTAEQLALQRRLADSDARLAAAGKRQAELEAAGHNAPNPPGTVSGRPFNVATGTRALPGNPLENPATQKMMASSMKASLDQRYGGLFRQLKLSPAELEKLKDLLTERQMSAIDAMNAARTQGVSLAGVPALVSKVQEDVDGSIRTLLGDERFNRYQDFNQNIASYSLLDQIERRLSYTNAPLQPAQSEALLRVLVETAPTAGAGPGTVVVGNNAAFVGAAPMIGMGGQSQISEATLARAGTVLDPAQTEVLRQLQTEQQNQVNLMQTLRAEAGGGGAGTVRFQAGTVMLSPGIPPPPPPPVPATPTP